MIIRESAPFGARPITIETGRVARQAGGAAWVQQGGTVVLVTCVGAHTVREGIDFFPLTCDYIEKTYAAGKIPGGFFKREGRPSEKEILSAPTDASSIYPKITLRNGCQPRSTASHCTARTLRNGRISMERSGLQAYLYAHWMTRRPSTVDLT